MRLVMMGTGTFAEPTFAALLAAFPGLVVGCVTQPERGHGRVGGSTRQTGRGMAAIAAEAGVPVVQPESINTPEGVAALAAFGADLAVVAAYGQILKPAVIATPRLGMINVHASLLPKFRGAAPVAHAILAGETETGVTIIRITPGLDAGEMLAKASVTIGDDETAGELEARIAPIGAELACETVRKMALGPVTGEKQDPAKVTKAPKLTKEMGLIDWNQPATNVIRQIYAMQPWPTAYTFLHRPGREPLRLALCRARLGGNITGTEPKPAPTAFLIDPAPLEKAIWANVANSIIRVLEIQPAGKKRMTAEEFLRGHPLPAGSLFGPERLP
jgi:methionyl-tRNA formyltransferase